MCKWLPTCCALSTSSQRDPGALERLSFDFGAITCELEDEGVASFRESWRKLLGALNQKRFAAAKDSAGQ